MVFCDNGPILIFTPGQCPISFPFIITEIWLKLYEKRVWIMNSSVNLSDSDVSGPIG